MKKRTDDSSASCTYRPLTNSTPHNIEVVVDCYIAECRERSRREMRFYRIQPTLQQSIEVSCLAKLPSGKRHPHQRRIPQAVLEESRRRLSAIDFKGTCRDFDELYSIVEHQIGDISGIGDLTIYDTAQRIGAYLGLEPDLIYLHAGTREGAKALGLDVANGTLTLQNLPKPFQRLKPYEIEDCLCIYKDELRMLRKRST